MLTPDIIQKIKHIQIHTLRLVSGMLLGDTRSALKGSGFDFDQIREYQLGDDVRSIDWNSSARADKIVVKQYREERNRTIMLLVDVSGSAFFSSSAQMKYDFFAHIASVLALAADYSKDLVGLLLFSDTVEHVIPAQKGRSHINRIMTSLFTHKPKGSRTNISAAFEHIAQLKKKDMVIFLISDCIDRNFEKQLKYIAHNNDVIVIQGIDPYEQMLPAVGFVTMQDIETGELVTVDLRAGQSVKRNFNLQYRLQAQEMMRKKYGISWLSIKPSKSYMGTLIQFFKREMMRTKHGR